MAVHRRTVRPGRRLQAVGVTAALLGAVTMLAAPSAGALPVTGSLIRVTDGSRDFYRSSVSDDGRYAAYYVEATDEAGTNSFVALRDRTSGTTQQVGPLGADGGEVSADGSTVAYRVAYDKSCSGTTVTATDVYLWQRATGTSVLISPAATCVNTYRDTPSVSANGSVAVYDDLVYPAGLDPVESVTVYNASSGTRSTIASAFEPRISDNGRFVSYLQFADASESQSNLYVYDRTTAAGTLVAIGADSTAPVSNDGRYVAYGTPSDAVVSLDRTSGISMEIAPDSEPADMTPDGRYVAFSGDFLNGSHGAGVWDRTTGDIAQIGSADAGSPSVSAAGTVVSFDSDLAEGLPGDDTSGNYDVYLWTRGAAITHTTAESFVIAGYLDYIGRVPTSAERAFGLAIVGDASSIQRRAQFTSALAQSDAYLGTVVNKLYIDTLGRTGDPGGVTYWTNELRSGRVTVAQTAGLFYSSGEYFAGYGNNNLNTWVTDLYNKILLRTPDSGGLAYYVDLAQRTNRYTVAYPFYQSVESSRTRTNALYQRFLGRPADAAGLDYWSTRIPALGDVALASNLTLSTEYLNRAHTRFP